MKEWRDVGPLRQWGQTLTSQGGMNTSVGNEVLNQINACAAAADETTLRPDYVGKSANYLEETNHAAAIAVWVSKHGAVWVDEDGEISIRSAYSKPFVADWHGTAILAAQRWCDTEMPVGRGEDITGERAAHVPLGTLLARVGEDGRVIAGQPVIVKDAGFTGSPTGRYRVLDLAPPTTADPS